MRDTDMPKPSEFPDVASYRLPPGGRDRLKAVLRPGEVAAIVVRDVIMAMIEARETIKDSSAKEKKPNATG
jgi:hypothetical protein